MTAPRPLLAPLRAICLLALLTLALLPRIVGPAAGMQARDGYVAICAGSEIIYVAVSELDGGAPTEPADPVSSEHCPWFAQAHAIDLPGIGTVFDRMSRPADPPRRVAAVMHSATAPASFRARAPPAVHTGPIPDI